MHVAKSPCSSCPYRKDVPAGVWHASEYEKLRQYDDGPKGQQAFGIFLCHQTPEIGKETACRGWLTVHCESVAARLAVMRGQITNEQRYAEVAEPLYATGNEAADAGLAGIEQPDENAQKIIDRLVKAGRQAR